MPSTSNKQTNKRYPVSATYRNRCGPGANSATAHSTRACHPAAAASTHAPAMPAVARPTVRGVRCGTHRPRRATSTPAQSTAAHVTHAVAVDDTACTEPVCAMATAATSTGATAACCATPRTARLAVPTHSTAPGSIGTAASRICREPSKPASPRRRLADTPTPCAPQAHNAHRSAWTQAWPPSPLCQKRMRLE